MRTRRQMGVGTGFVLVITLMVVLLVHGLARLWSISQDLNQVVDLHGRKVDIVTDMQLAGYQRTGALSALVLAVGPLQGGAVTDALAHLESRMHDGWAALRLLGLGPDESANLNRQAALVARMHALQEEVVEYKEADQNRLANAVLRQQLIPLQRALARELQALRETAGDNIAEAVRNARDTRDFTAKFTIHLGFFCVLLAILVALSVSRQLRRQRLRIERYIRQLAASRDVHRRLATHDTLTELPNRALFNDRLEQALLRGRRGRARCAVVFLDLDNFKEINDRHGHHAGDQVLKEAAGRLRRGLRKSDTVARIGGDEFAALLESLAGCEEAEQVMEALGRQLSEPFRVDGTEVRLTMSLGIAHYPGDGDDAQSLLKVADGAMYRMKSRGRQASGLVTRPSTISAEARIETPFPRSVDAGVQWQ